MAKAAAPTVAAGRSLNAARNGSTTKKAGEGGKKSVNFSDDPPNGATNGNGTKGSLLEDFSAEYPQAKSSSKGVPHRYILRTAEVWDVVAPPVSLEPLMPRGETTDWTELIAFPVLLHSNRLLSQLTRHSLLSPPHARFTAGQLHKRAFHPKFPPEIPSQPQDFCGGIPYPPLCRR